MNNESEQNNYGVKLTGHSGAFTKSMQLVTGLLLEDFSVADHIKPLNLDTNGI